MNDKKSMFMLAAVGALLLFAGTANVAAWAAVPGQAGGADQSATQFQAGGADQPDTRFQAAGVDPAHIQPSVSHFAPGWNQWDGRWYWMSQEGNIHTGWLQDQGRTYYLDESGGMVTGWREVDGEWYYFHEDGGLNLGQLVVGNGTYQFSDQGALVSAGWVENTGGGAYDAGCYDDVTQELFDRLNEEKRDLYFEEYPDREEEYDGDIHRVYDRYAGFRMDMALNKAAAHRLAAASIYGYADDRVPGEGDIHDYLAVINGRKNASCLELYVRSCEDGADAFEKVKGKLDNRFQAKNDRKYSLEYYRKLGMAHEERDGKHYFMIILMR